METVNDQGLPGVEEKEGWIGVAQRVFRAVELLYMVL